MAIFANVEGVISDNPGLTAVELDIAARAALAEIVNDVIIPEAANNAPGSIGPQIRMGQVKRTGVGSYAVDILVPKKYQAVEQGSGVYGGGGEYTIVPKGPGGVLATADGPLIAHATQIGQPGQHFVHDAVQAHLGDVASAIFKEIRHGLGSRVTSSPTK